MTSAVIVPGTIVRASTQDVDAFGVYVPGTGFKNALGVLTDPTAIVLRWRVAGGIETIWTFGTDAQIVHDSVGAYHADIAVVSAGLHYGRWVGTGAVISASEFTFSATSNFVGTP